jgi:outer membrane protein assembly factor BamB/predicted alpha/beta superfamily hydrolase
MYRLLRGRIIASLVSFLCACSLHAADWPAWGGPNDDFTVPDAGVFGSDGEYALRVAWRRPIGTGYAAVVVRGDLAVTMFSDEKSDYVIAFDANTGALRWRHTIGPAYLGHYGSQSGPISTPLIDGDRVIALGPRGRLFALDAESGGALWSVDLVTAHDAAAPFWGFTSSPKLLDGRLVVQTGGSRDNVISAFDPATGATLWSAHSDSVDYQSPSLVTLADEPHVLFHGNNTLAGLDPASGEVLWILEHGGQTGATSTSGHPVEIREGRYFVKNRGDGGVLVDVTFSDAGYAASTVWDTRDIRGTYIYPVHHDGMLFGQSGRILTCLDAETGDRIWSSREPGDGLPIVVDGHLVIITKDGRLSVAPASRDGFTEVAGLQLFDDIVWSPASFANGRLYARSMSEIAAVEILPGEAADAGDGETAGIVRGSHFAAFVDSVSAAREKQPLVDRFLARHETFPVVEGEDIAHFLYHGDATHVTMTGDHVGRRYDQPLHRVDGTNLFFYSMRLEPDARITYRYTIDLQNDLPDPRNPHAFRSLFFGEASELAMPRWIRPAHLAPPEGGARGRIDTLAFTSESVDGNRELLVYLPPGYDASDGRYPVAYVHAARHPFRMGRLDVSLDNLVGKSVQPVIVVVIPSLTGGGYHQYVGAGRDTYKRIFVEEILPLVESTYATLETREGRANVGTIFGGLMAFFATTSHPDLFGGAAIQTMAWDQSNDAAFETLIPPASSIAPVTLYLDWGRYDLRSPLDGNDMGISSETFARRLQERGYTFVGGEVNDGAGWASWKNRTDRVFEALFPLAD